MTIQEKYLELRKKSVKKNLSTERKKIYLPIRCPLKKDCACLMKSLKNMPENLETMTDSVRLRPLF